MALGVVVLMIFGQTFGARADEITATAIMTSPTVNVTIYLGSPYEAWSQTVVSDHSWYKDGLALDYIQYAWGQSPGSSTFVGFMGMYGGFGSFGLSYTGLSVTYGGQGPTELTITALTDAHSVWSSISGRASNLIKIKVVYNDPRIV